MQFHKIPGSLSTILFSKSPLRYGIIYFLLTAILAAPSAFAAIYCLPVKLSLTPYNELNPATGDYPINNKGQVAWVGTDSNNNSQIYLFDGSTTKNISKNNTSNGSPVINDNGAVAWMASVTPSSMAANIWYYSGGTAGHQITTDGSAGLGDLNNSGKIAYTDSSPQGFGIFQYPGNGMIWADGMYPRINKNGQIVFIDSYNQLHLNSGSDKVIATKVYGEYAINGVGQVAWESWSSSFQTQIYLYGGGGTTTIVNNGCYNEFNGKGQFNARGEVVWLGQAGAGTGDIDIYLYSGGVTKQITQNGQGATPSVNDSGQVVWGSWDAQNHPHIYLYSNGVTQTVADVALHSPPIINNLGQIAYVDQNDWQVYLLSPVGLKIKKPVAPILNLLLGN